MLARTIAVAATFLLTGCTITTYGNEPPPPPPPQPQAQRAPAAQPRQPAPAAARPRVPLRPGIQLGGSGAGSDVAPKITSPNAFGNGTGGAFRGLAYVIPENTTALPNLATLVPFATLYTDSFQVQPQDFSGGFPGALAQDEWFAIRYDGPFSVPKDGTVQFKLVSDDGAVLYVDGQKVIDNDGQHTAKPAFGQRELKAGGHRLRLEYFQAKKGSVALMLFVVEAGQERPLLGGK